MKGLFILVVAWVVAMYGLHVYYLKHPAGWIAEHSKVEAKLEPPKGCADWIEDDTLTALRPWARRWNVSDQPKQVEQEIEHVRQWAKSQQDPCVRYDYGRWLDVYARESKKAMERHALPQPPAPGAPQ